MQLSLFDDLYDAKSPKDELIEKGLLSGSRFEAGRKRVIESAANSPNPEQLAIFLKGMHGIGGFSSPTRAPNYIHRENHDGRGIQFWGTDRDGNEVVGDLKWIDVAKLILEMVRNGTYRT